MANLEIIDQKGKSAGNVDLNEEIFGIELMKVLFLMLSLDKELVSVKVLLL